MAMSIYRQLINTISFLLLAVLLVIWFVIPLEIHISIEGKPLPNYLHANHPPINSAGGRLEPQTPPLSSIAQNDKIPQAPVQQEIAAQLPSHNTTRQKVHREKGFTHPRFAQNVVSAQRDAPTCKMYNYVRYWRYPFTYKYRYESPLRPQTRDMSIESLLQQQYVVFQPDLAGWNNVRIAFEIVILIAHSTGRTLVLPYDLKPFSAMLNSRMDIKLEDIYDFEKLNDTMTIISMSTFLTQVASREGVLKERFNYTGDLAEYIRYPSEDLWQYMYRACYIEKWKVTENLLAFNILDNRDLGDPNRLVVNTTFTTTPLLQYILQLRRIRPYDELLASERALFFPSDMAENYRVFANYYYYLYWEDRRVRKFYMRFIRDRVHYRDLLFCAASQIVRMIHEEVRQLYNKTMPLSMDLIGGNVFQPNQATYHAMHIRRQDFYTQFASYTISIEQMWSLASKVIDLNASKLIYISTDELNTDEFKVITQSNPTIQIRYLKDYLKYLPNFFKQSVDNGYTFRHNMKAVQIYHVGMIEQIICANAHTFMGTYLSTFSSYITRIRGYYRD